jgi:hypothetical protein
MADVGASVRIAQGHQHDRASADQGLRLQAQPVPAARREPPDGQFFVPCRRQAASVPRIGARRPTEAARSLNNMFPVGGLTFCANALPDGSPERADLLSLSDDVENWFRVESNRPCKSTLTSPRPDRPGVRDCGIPPTEKALLRRLKLCR